MGEQKKKTLTREMAEKMILAKLYKDGLFVLDDDSRTVNIDARDIRGRYGEESYADIVDIIKRMVKGLELEGYDVTVQWLDIRR